MYRNVDKLLLISKTKAFHMLNQSCNGTKPVFGKPEQHHKADQQKTQTMHKVPWETFMTSLMDIISIQNGQQPAVKIVGQSGSNKIIVNLLDLFIIIRKALRSVAVYLSSAKLE